MTTPGSAVPPAAELVAMIPYAATLGMTLDEAAPGLVRGSLRWSPGLCTTGGVMNGGAVMSLADNIGALCAFLNLPPGAGTATVQSATNFFRALREGTLHATARPLHVGRSFVVVRTDLTDDQDRQVGQTTQTQAVIAAQAPASS
jgi:1,4-dihydroxy-2-naphthoyl-CoA hydrolase